MKKSICISLFCLLTACSDSNDLAQEAASETADVVNTEHQDPAEGGPADMILKSRHVVTMVSNTPQPARALAIAIRGDRIAWIGPQTEAGDWTGPDTAVVDHGDAAILPGFIDAHGHVTFSALVATLANVASPPVGPVNTISDLQNTLKAYIQERDIAAGEWVVGMGYDDSLIAEGRHPIRDDLDAVSTTHPILLIHVSGHLASANSQALAIGGITAASIDPPGGVIRRRPGTQEPDGVLEETATAALRQYMAAPNKDPLGSLTNVLRDYASRGITTAQDGAANAQVMAVLTAAAENGLLPIDVVAYPVADGTPDAFIDRYPWGQYQGRFKTGGVKLILDGSPQGKTAYLSQPYHVPPPGQDPEYAGYPTVTPAETTRLVGAFLAEHIPIIAHANGDAAGDMLINAVAIADPAHDHRTVMIHAQTAREDQLDRIKSLGMIPSFFSTHTFYWGDWHRDSVLGPERGHRISPTASTLARDMIFTVHNDAPIVPPDMLRLLWSTTNRVTRSGQVLGAEQRVNTYEALKAITRHAAYQYFEEADKGTLERGKLADLVVLSEDPLAVDPARLTALEIRATYSHGRQVYP